jgi:hypothetical protein
MKPGRRQWARSRRAVGSEGGSVVRDVSTEVEQRVGVS